MLNSCANVHHWQPVSSTYKIASTSCRFSASCLEPLSIADAVLPITYHSNHSVLSAKIRKRAALSVRVWHFRVVRETARGRRYVLCTVSGEVKRAHRQEVWRVSITAQTHVKQCRIVAPSCRCTSVRLVSYWTPFDPR